MEKVKDNTQLTAKEKNLILKQLCLICINKEISKILSFGGEAWELLLHCCSTIILQILIRKNSKILQMENFTKVNKFTNQSNLL